MNKEKRQETNPFDPRPFWLFGGAAVGYMIGFWTLGEGIAVFTGLAGAIAAHFLLEFYRRGGSAFVVRIVRALLLRRR